MSVREIATPLSDEAWVYFRRHAIRICMCNLPEGNWLHQPPNERLLANPYSRVEFERDGHSFEERRQPRGDKSAPCKRCKHVHGMHGGPPTECGYQEPAWGIMHWCECHERQT